MPLTTGQIIHNRYRIVSLLGQGGMGAVYRAWDVNLNVPVALKEMLPDPSSAQRALAKLRAQFQREAQVVAGLNHPNLVRVTDYFSWGGSECLVMNFVDGESLADRIQREGAQPEAQVLEWAQQLLDALGYCHARGVIHRDVKPQNVIITPSPALGEGREGGRAVLVDFGLVKLWDPQNPRTQTVIRAMGTPEYAPPEQYSAIAGHTDPRSDLYSLGATLYHALTGQSPISATDRMARPEQFASPRSLAPRVSQQTDAAVLKALELPITQRFSTAQEMADTLRGAPSVPPPPDPSRQVHGEAASLGVGLGRLCAACRLHDWAWCCLTRNPGRWPDQYARHAYRRGVYLHAVDRRCHGYLRFCYADAGAFYGHTGPSHTRPTYPSPRNSGAISGRASNCLQHVEHRSIL